MKWLKRIDVLTEPYTGEFQTGHYMYEWPDRAPEPVDIMRVRARITDPAPGATIDAGSYTVRGKAWSGSGPITTVEVSLTGAGDWEPAQLEPRAGPLPVAGLVLHLAVAERGSTHPASTRHRRGRQRAARSAPVEPPRLRQQRHRGALRRRPLMRPVEPARVGVPNDGSPVGPPRHKHIGCGSTPVRTPSSGRLHAKVHAMALHDSNGTPLTTRPRSCTTRGHGADVAKRHRKPGP